MFVGHCEKKRFAAEETRTHHLHFFHMAGNTEKMDSNPMKGVFVGDEAAALRSTSLRW